MAERERLPDSPKPDDKAKTTPAPAATTPAKPAEAKADAPKAAEPGKAAQRSTGERQTTRKRDRNRSSKPAKTDVTGESTRLTAADLTRTIEFVKASGGVDRAGELIDLVQSIQAGIR